MPGLSDAESVNQCQQGLMCRNLLLHFQTCTDVGSLKMRHVKGVSGCHIFKSCDILSYSSLCVNCYLYTVYALTTNVFEISSPKVLVKQQEFCRMAALTKYVFW